MRTAPYGSDPGAKPWSAPCLGRHHRQAGRVPRVSVKRAFSAFVAALLPKIGSFVRIADRER